MGLDKFQRTPRTAAERPNSREFCNKVPDNLASTLASSGFRSTTPFNSRPVSTPRSFGRFRSSKASKEQEQQQRPSWHTAPGPAPQLHSSIVAPRSGRARQDALSSPYLWSPVQVKQHQQTSEMSYGIGTYVNTLSMDVMNRSFKDASSHIMRVESGNFVAKGSLWCYLIGGSFVVCKGFVVGTCPKPSEVLSGSSMCMARLPNGHRPDKPLQFAAVSRMAHDVGGHTTYSSNLVTLIVMPDGRILGSSGRDVEGAIDLSAIRFSVGRGICLIDDVTLHTCDLQGSRMVSLQGTLSERFFAVHNFKPLALLPESCRPASTTPFIVAGSASGGFHLIVLAPRYGFGTGGDLVWRDSVWNHDHVNMTGIMFEVAPDALEHSALNTKWSGESQKIFIEDFQRFLIRRFGSLEQAWKQAFDPDGSGSINFTAFGFGCKASGFVGNATRLWAALDDDRTGEISLEELTVDANLIWPGTAVALCDDNN